MIKHLKIKNFKALKDASFDLAGVNLLAGLNGMGKSSLIQILLLLRNSASRLAAYGNLDLQFYDQQLGKAREVFYQFAAHRSAKLELEVHYSTYAGPQYKHLAFEYAPDQDFFHAETPCDLADISLSSNDFQYISADRPGPRNYYSTHSATIEQMGQIGPYGEYAVHYLNAFGRSRMVHSQILSEQSKSETLIHQTEAWMSLICPGTRINTRDIPGNSSSVMIDYQFDTLTDYSAPVRPINTGSGISYVLPVIVALLMAQPGRLIIIENPEAHLHPRGQAAMGRLIALAAKAGAQLIIETHSDHVINGLRVAVKESVIAPELARLFYFELVQTDFERHAQVTPIDIDRHGSLSSYPEGFLDEWDQQLLKLI